MSFCIQHFEEQSHTYYFFLSIFFSTFFLFYSAHFILLSMAKKTEFVTPGQRLGYAADYNQGPGTYERDGLLYASVVGQRYIDPAKEGQVRSLLSQHFFFF